MTQKRGRKYCWDVSRTGLVNGEVNSDDQEFVESGEARTKAMAFAFAKMAITDYPDTETNCYQIEVRMVWEELTRDDDDDGRWRWLRDYRHVDED